MTGPLSESPSLRDFCIKWRKVEPIDSYGGRVDRDVERRHFQARPVKTSMRSADEPYLSSTSRESYICLSTNSRDWLCVLRKIMGTAFCIEFLTYAKKEQRYCGLLEAVRITLRILWRAKLYISVVIRLKK